MSEAQMDGPCLRVRVDSALRRERPQDVAACCPTTRPMSGSDGSSGAIRAGAQCRDGRARRCADVVTVAAAAAHLGRAADLAARLEAPTAVMAVASVPRRRPATASAFRPGRRRRRRRAAGHGSPWPPAGSSNRRRAHTAGPLAGAGRRGRPARFARRGVRPPPAGGRPAKGARSRGRAGLLARRSTNRPSRRRVVSRAVAADW